jgi:hypothetical protein
VSLDAKERAHIEAHCIQFDSDSFVYSGYNTEHSQQCVSIWLNTCMKELLRNLPQILGAMPEIVKYLKYIPVLMVLAGIGYGIFFYMENHKDPFICVNNQVFEQLRIDSDVYVFKGETCVDAKDVK